MHEREGNGGFAGAKPQPKGERFTGRNTASGGKVRYSQDLVQAHPTVITLPLACHLPCLRYVEYRYIRDKLLM